MQAGNPQAYGGVVADNWLVTANREALEGCRKDWQGGPGGPLHH